MKTVRCILICVSIISIILITIHACVMIKFTTDISLHMPSRIILTNKTKEWDFLLKNEHWVFTHFHNPSQVYMFIPSFFISIFIIYTWETLEAIVITLILNNISIYGGNLEAVAGWMNESIADSLIGDTLIGTIGILYSAFFMTTHFPNIKRNVLYSLKTDRNILYSFLLYLILTAALDLLSGLTLHMNTTLITQQMHNDNVGLNIIHIAQGNDNSTVINNPTSMYLYPLGYLLYPFIKLISFELIWITIMPKIITKETRHEIPRFIIWFIVSFLWVYISSIFLLTPTYFSLFIGIGTCFLFLNFIFYKPPTHLNTHITKKN